MKLLNKNSGFTLFMIAYCCIISTSRKVFLIVVLPLELLGRNMSRVVKKKIVKAVVWPVALYGCETSALKKDEIERLNALEMWMWRGMERVSWKDRKKNEEVLDMVGAKRSIVETIVKRKKNWIGHILRGEGLLKDVIEGRMEGKPPRGRKRIGMIDDLKEKSYQDMKRRAETELAGEVGYQGPAYEAEHQ